MQSKLPIMIRFDLHFMIRNRETLMWMFLMPVIFMYLIGIMTKERSGDSSAKTQIAVIDEDGGPLAKSVTRHLEALDYEVVVVDADSTLAKYRRQLRIPAGFSEKAIAGEEQKVSFFHKGSSSSLGDLHEVKMNRALFATLGDLLIITGENGVVSEESLASVGDRPPAIEIEEIPAVSAIDLDRVPSGFQQSVPGILVMFVLLVLLTTGGVMLVTERDEGLLRRLASAPVTRQQIVFSKIFARISLGLIQAAFAMVVGTLPPFRIDWGGQLPAILLLLTLYGVSTAALSVLFGNLARSRGQAVGLGVLSANVLAALGGCWWPIEIASPVMQKVAWLLPTGWTMYGMHRLMSFGDSIGAIVPSLALLAASAVLFFFLAARTFRFE